ncbi:MAG: cytoplasmic protein [bacterium]|nr:cytoplasmic protein [bacterium]
MDDRPNSIDPPPERLISEAIKPLGVFGDTAVMAAGSPGLPEGFAWRDEELKIVEVLDTWKSVSDCKSGSSEKYVRRHWFQVRCDRGREYKLYFQRQGGKRQRWFLYSIVRDV